MAFFIYAAADKRNALKSKKGLGFGLSMLEFPHQSRYSCRRWRSVCTDTGHDVFGILSLSSGKQCWKPSMLGVIKQL